MGITASHRHKRRHKMTDDLPNSKNDDDDDDDDDGNDSSEEVEGRHLLKEVLKQIVRSGNVSIFSLVRVPYKQPNNTLSRVFFVAHIRRLFT
jgi:hypothetical protein